MWEYVYYAQRYESFYINRVTCNLFSLLLALKKNSKGLLSGDINNTILLIAALLSHHFYLTNSLLTDIHVV